MIEPGEQLKGRGLTVWIEDDCVMIKYGVMFYGFLGTKRVPVSNITAVNWKEPGGWTVGFLELSILGEPAPSPHASPNVQHQNRLSFEHDQLAKFMELRDWIQARLGKPSQAAISPSSAADEITKLAALLKDGHLTPEEFAAQKTKLLG
jgi:hypothetical protein